MRIWIFSLSLLFCFFETSLNARIPDPVAVKGLLDLRKLSDPNHFIIKLNGEWEFYWKELLKPDDFKTPGYNRPFYGKVPSYWTDYPFDSVKTEKSGFATYRLKVILPEGLRKPLSVDLPVFDSSYEIYIDGKYYGGNGTPGKSEADTKPGYKRNFYSFTPDSDSLEIIIDVSNFAHRRGGFWLPVEFGTLPEVMKRMADSWAGELSVISLLLGFSLFFLFIFSISPKERIIGFFSMTTIGLALRPLFTSHYLILEILNIEWTWLIRFEYISLILIIIGSTWFIMNLYPSNLFRIFSWIITVFFSIAMVITVSLPVKIFSYMMEVYYPAAIILLLYVLYRSFVGILKKNSLDIVYFSAFVLLLLGGLHDISVAQGKSDNSIGYVLSYLIVLFVFIQAALLVVKWVNAFNERKRLQDELGFMNKNLEHLVNERTQELKSRNMEIQMQNERIAEQNKLLSDTIQLKNRIFSVVAHDLRAPVVNILYMLNLLKEKEYKEHYDTFADSSIQYAQNVISLLENMLVWGRGQEDKIKIVLQKLDLADIIQTNLSIFREIADNKKIRFNFMKEGSTMAFIDKDLMDIIIRNLLSNAVKYTPYGGSINISVKDGSQTGQGFILKICDNGVGIPETKQKDLFTSAEIKSTPGTEGETGTGLGLKLCYELVRLNNGSISIDSKEGVGTCFIITLPAA
jgi:signal transduction histidine kinase